MSAESEPAAPGPLPLRDLIVAEFSHAIMGPSAGMVLADLGAEVIKVEPAPDGDPTRRLTGSGVGFFGFQRNVAVGGHVVRRCLSLDGTRS